MAGLTREQVLEQLSKVKGPDLAGDLVSLNMVEGVFVDGRKVIFSIKVPAERAKELEPLRKAAETAVLDVEGAEKVTAVLTAERTRNDPVPKPAAPKPPSKPQQSPARSNSKVGIPGIKSIVAVASGKGGVGKSTTSVNLALALSGQGLKVGILDADIYGPSLPRLLGITEKPTADGKALNPITRYGLKVMSMGFLVEEESPMIWRGPMVISALTQMLREVVWGELDVLIVDMPPGTGDAQLTMAQQVPLAGAVIVSTPQDLALIDARKGLNMFRKVEVPILGIVENMSTFICPSCGESHAIFGHGGARSEAEKLGIPFLGEVPLHMDIRTHSDGGTPVVTSQPDGPHAEAYRQIAQNMLGSLGASDAKTQAPAIHFD